MVAALTPDPATVGDRMFGRAIVGTWVIGRKDGQAREVYLYQKTVGEDCWRDLGLQAVGWQTGFNPVIAMEMLSSGAWSGAGVLGPESFPAQAVPGRHDRPRDPLGARRARAGSEPPDLTRSTSAA